MFGIHVLDILAILAYLLVILLLGARASRGAHTQDGFFLAGRSLGRVYQFFLNFGNATDANTAVSTASFVYQQGVSGVWLSFQMVFMNPYFWFMNLWFRRVRLVTMADLFADRLGSRRLAQFYAVFQIVVSVAVTIGFGNLVAYKICASLVVKPETTWTVAEQQAVAEHQELKALEKAAAGAAGGAATSARLGLLREKEARGELRSTITMLDPMTFYVGYTVVVAMYIIMGGMAATALNEVFQGVLIVLFSIILIPTGLSAIGGWGALAEKVPESMFHMIGTDSAARISGWALAAIFSTALLQINGIIGNMGIGGSAKNELAARFGAVSGTYAKRFMTIAWAFVGLIAVALFSGGEALSDPDAVWGAMSHRLLGPGLLGLMLAGVLAANMSTVAAQTMSVAALFVRNIYQYLRPQTSDAAGVTVGRWTIAAVLVAGIAAATMMDNVFTVMQVLLTVNVPFGASVLLMFFWRRLTVPAVWTAVFICALHNVVVPLVVPMVPSWRSHPALVVRNVSASGKYTPVFFESVVRVQADRPDSPLEGRGRFHTEIFTLSRLGLDVAGMSGSGRFAARFFFDAVSPVLLLVLVSLLTRAPDRGRVDQFYGRMKTPVGTTPELERQAMLETVRNPSRFDHLKLFPRSSWEFTRWDRVDGVGFIACTAVSGMIIAIFWGLLRLAS